MDSERPEEAKPQTGKDMHSQTLSTQAISIFALQVKSLLCNSQCIPMQLLLVWVCRHAFVIQTTAASQLAD